MEEQIVKEIQKLLAAGFIKLIQHPKWLSNIVPVKKKNGQIQCCVDEFSLLNIKLLINSAAWSAMFSFMDRFSGYNQIRIASRDAEKLPSEHPIRISTTP